MRKAILVKVFLKTVHCIPPRWTIECKVVSVMYHGVGILCFLYVMFVHYLVILSSILLTTWSLHHSQWLNTRWIGWLRLYQCNLQAFARGIQTIGRRLSSLFSRVSDMWPILNLVSNKSWTVSLLDLFVLMKVSHGTLSYFILNIHQWHTWCNQSSIPFLCW